MASPSTPPPCAASSASTLYEWPCSGSLIPRYSRRKCAASNRASTRTLKLPTRPREDVLDHFLAHPQLPQLFRRRLRAQQILGLPIVPAVVRTVSFRQLDERQKRLPARLVEHGPKCTMRADSDAASEERYLLELQEDIPRRVEAVSLLRLRRVAREGGVAGAPLHATEASGVGIAHRQIAAAARRARRARPSSAATARRPASATTAAAAAETRRTRSRSAPAAATQRAPPATTAAAGRCGDA